jgi:aryl-alcohol dehydrogenase-like predicted oxidoreductase
MKQRKLGNQGLVVSELGLGCMGMSEFYGIADESEAIATIHRALELGVTLLDTADMYGVGHNEELVGKAIKGHRDRVIIATKFGNVRGSDGSFKGVNGKPEYVRSCCDASLKRLGVDAIDLYYQHRVDPKPRAPRSAVQWQCILFRHSRLNIRSGAGSQNPRFCPLAES